MIDACQAQAGTVIGARMVWPLKGTVPVEENFAPGIIAHHALYRCADHEFAAVTLRGSLEDYITGRFG